jgi:sugar phosphate isomerase/epimerase
MRFRHPAGSVVHLAYCSNVHPAEDVDGVISQLSRFAAPLKETLDVPCLGVGLWLAAPVAAALLEDTSSLDRLRSTLGEHDLEVVTFNGFPYRAFHAPVVKRDVYVPDWTDPARADYTLDLARLLALLLSDDVEEGSISTLPLGWRTDWSERSTDEARYALERVTEGLEKLAGETGRKVRLALEPEPGCVVETVEGAIEALGSVDPEWIGVCLDACHMAVQFEDPEASLTALREASIPVCKAQISSALHVSHPGDPKTRNKLAGFAEPRFLHQTRERTPKGIVGVDDLDDALAGKLPTENEWRVHFHVPVHHSGDDTTQSELAASLDALLGGESPATTHLEVETYTWSVLPPSDRPEDDAGLVGGLARELSWTRERLLELGLREVGR